MHSDHTNRKVRPFADLGEEHNLAITRPVTIGANVKKPAAIALRDISYVIESIRKGVFEGQDLRPLIMLIRQAIDSQLKRNLKSQLPYFMGSVCAKIRANSNVQYAWYAIFDIDGVESVPRAKQAILEKVPFASYVFQSVTNGVKIVAEFAAPIRSEEIYKRIYRVLAYQIKKLTGFSCDNTNDWARCCYMPYDPLAVYNPKAKAIDVRNALLAWEALDAVENPKTRFVAASGPEPNGKPDWDKAVRICMGLSKQILEYNDWITVGFCLYRCFGEAGKELWDMFANNPNYRDSQRHLTQKWASFRKADDRAGFGVLVIIGRRYGAI